MKNSSSSNIQIGVSFRETLSAIKSDQVRGVLESCSSVVIRELKTSTSLKKVEDLLASLCSFPKKLSSASRSYFYEEGLIFVEVLSGTREETPEEALPYQHVGQYRSPLMTVTITAREDIGSGLYDAMKKVLPPPPTEVDWMWGEAGESSSFTPVSVNVGVDEMYPYIKEGLSAYCDRFLSSNSSILILIGEPGTGKTSFIKYLLHQKRQSAQVTYNNKVLSSDYAFMNFLEGDIDMFVIEDADDFIRDREGERNDMMHRFLSAGDGLVSLPNKKIVFSTNLTDAKKIDPALIRKGRCFDVLKTRSLTWEECGVLSKKTGFELPAVAGNYSIAELFNQDEKDREIHKASIGFR